jgi:hypothetical protein
MLSLKSFRRLFFGSLILCLAASGFFSLRLLAQQQPRKRGSLTQPPKANSSKADAADNGTNSTVKGALTVGERLTFNVSWANFVSAARMEMEVMERGAFFGRECYQLRTRVETIGYARSLLADVDNQYNAFVDAKTLLPQRVESSTRQGQKKSDESVVFDQHKNTAVLEDGAELPIPDETYDLASMSYALRLKDLKSGTKTKFNVLAGKKVVEVEASVKETERVITQAGAYEAVRVDFSSKSTEDSEKYKVRVWFSTDNNHIPVMMKAQLPFGEVRAELSSSAINSKVKPFLNTQPGNTQPGGKNTVPGQFIEEPLTEEPLSEFERNLPFVVGERLSYDISWLNFASTGQASFSVRRQGRLNGYRVFVFDGDVATTGVARTVLSVNDAFTSYVDTRSLTPIRTETQLREGSRIRNTAADYDWTASAVAISNGSKLPLKGKTLDVVSLLYAVRASDLGVGSSFSYDFLDANHRVNTLNFKVIKQEIIGGPLGAQNTVQLDISRADKQQVMAQAWISNDARRLPIYIAVRLNIGELRFQLTRAFGTK